MDKICIHRTVLGATVLVIIGLASLYVYSVTGTTAIAFGYSIFFAIAMFLPKVLPSVLMSKVFGTKEYGAIYAFANLFFLIGAAFGSVLTSIIQGIVGYGITWIVYMFVAIALFCVYPVQSRAARNCRLTILREITKNSIILNAINLRKDE